MQTTAKPVTKRDYITELQSCTTLEALCRLRDELSELSKGCGDEWELAAVYSTQASTQIAHLLERGLFLAPVGDDERELKRELAELRAALTNVEERAYFTLLEIAETDASADGVARAISIAGEDMEMFAPSPTDDTNR